MMRRVLGGALALALIASPALAQRITVPPVIGAIPVTVAQGGTNCTAASATCVDNITGGTHTGTGANAVFQASPLLSTPTEDISDAVTNAVSTVVTKTHNTSGTAAANFGLSDLYRLENASGSLADVGSFDFSWVTATAAAEDGVLKIYVMKAGVKTLAVTIDRFGDITTPAGGDYLGLGSVRAGNTSFIYWNGRVETGSSADQVWDCFNSAHSAYCKVNINKIGNKGTAPALTGCGSSPAILGTDLAGTITEGTIATGCIATFNVAFAAAPYCVVTSQSGLVFTYAVSTTALTITNVGALSSTKIDYNCIGT